MYVHQVALSARARLLFYICGVIKIKTSLLCKSNGSAEFISSHFAHKSRVQVFFSSACCYTNNSNKHNNNHMYMNLVCVYVYALQQQRQKKYIQF